MAEDAQLLEFGYFTPTPTRTNLFALPGKPESDGHVASRFQA